MIYKKPKIQTLKKYKTSSIINEEKVKDGENLTLKKNKLLLEIAEKSVCEIIKDYGYGTGFFCKIKTLNKEMYCLITNDHVLTKFILLNKEYIEIKLNNEIIKISLNIYRKIWNDEELDFTCIEIIEEDNIIDKIIPFELDDNCYISNYNNNEYKKKGIVIPSIGITKEIEIPQGIIYYVNKCQDMFIHDCNTEKGYSGAPIILINNLKIIGIHKGFDKKKNKNIGIYFQKIINKIKKEKEIYENNIIEYILDIKKNELKNDIILFNQSEKNKNEIKDNIIVFLNNKKINIINEAEKWKIDYNFIIEGKYNLKIIFKKNINDLCGFFNGCSLIYSIDLSNFNSSNITDMGWMFNECHKLKEIKGINNYDTNKVTKMNSIFQGCNELEYLDLSNFNTWNVTDMEGMFNECHKLKEIKGINNFKTNKVTKMNGMFQGCNELEYLDLSNFNIFNVDNMEGMFNLCHN